MKPKYEVADVFRRFGIAYPSLDRQGHGNPGVYSGDNQGKGTSINREGHFALPALQAGDDGVSL